MNDKIMLVCEGCSGIVEWIGEYHMGQEVLCEDCLKKAYPKQVIT